MYPDNFPLSIVLFPVFMTGIFPPGQSFSDRTYGEGWVGRLVGDEMENFVGV